MADAVDVTGVEPFLRRFFGDLSDGERQRVMIARSLAQTPHLEPRIHVNRSSQGTATVPVSVAKQP